MLASTGDEATVRKLTMSIIYKRLNNNSKLCLMGMALELSKRWFYSEALC